MELKGTEIKTEGLLLMISVSKSDFEAKATIAKFSRATTIVKVIKHVIHFTFIDTTS